MKKDLRNVRVGLPEPIFPGGVYEYEKEFEVPSEWEGKKILIRFEGIYRKAEISVNGVRVGKIVNGYTERTFELAPALHYGTKNTMKAVVDNSEVPNSRWYSGSGIYRPVTLFVLESGHIELDGIRINTISYAPAKIAVSVKHTGGAASVSVLDEGKVVASVAGDVVELEIPDAKLWSETDPFLYICKVVLKDGEVITDTREASFGIRKIEWSPKGLLINGQETLLRGGCVHHDNGILGACAYAEAEERKVRIMKEYGYNAIRSSHNPCSRAMLDACDRLGMYMIDETWDMWYQHKSKYDYAADFMDNYTDDIDSMVQKDYNHPCVLMYSIGNEISEPAKEEGIELARKMIGHLHGLDDSRPVTAGLNLMIVANASKGQEMYNEDGGVNADTASEIGGVPDEGASQMPDMSQMNSTMFNQMAMMVGAGMNHSADSEEADKATTPILDALDIAGYNYASGRYPLEGEAHPDRIVFGSETFPQDIPVNWAMVEQYPYLIGDFMWTAWDYLGEAGLGAWAYTEDAMSFNKPYPWLLGGAGVIDLIGHGDGSALLAKAVWGKNNGQIGIAVTPANHPGIEVIKSAWRGTNAIPSWSWKGCEGNPVTVEVYTKAAKVVLSLNGNVIGETAPENCKVCFETIYQPGELSAVGYDQNGAAIESGSLYSAVGNNKICLRAESSAIANDAVVFVEVNICGENGVVESNADEMLTVRAEGAEILGFGSAQRRTEESFVTFGYTSYYGRALAAVRITDAEHVKIAVKGATLEEQEILL
ncbi:MAG: DUF4982 domain-containing protein [Lachnospiraceae bacterium]|nr:DUF4982 domain-containing protein [Lachnospiraceae bacterium]